MTILEKADACELEIKTDPIALTVGVSPDEMVDSRGEPRPDLDGTRCKFANRPPVYLIMDGGYRRHIPNPSTYNNLFRNWEDIVVDNDIDEIPEIRAIQSGAVLVTGDETLQVYMVDLDRKRHITSPAVMNKYYFNWGRIYNIPQATIDAMPTGPSIS